MDSYRIFQNEEKYMQAKASAMSYPQGKMQRRMAIRMMKEVYGSVLRKLLEVNGWHSGQFLSADTIKKILDKYALPKETYQFLVCLIEAYNDNAEFMKRETRIRKWKRLRVQKKHFNAYLLSGMRELKGYRPLFSSAEDREQFQAMKRAIILYNEILKVFFTRKPLMHISWKLYEKCLAADSGFARYYEKDGDRARLTAEGKECAAYRRGGLKNTFSDEVVWQFVLYIVRLER